MKTFITVLFCIVAAQLVLGAVPPPKPPKEGEGKDSAKKASAIKEVTAAIEKAKVASEGDKEAIKKLDYLKAQIIKIIENAKPSKGTPPEKGTPPPTKGTTPAPK